MASSFYRIRYLLSKARDSLSSSLKSYEVGQISGKELFNQLWKDTFQERMTVIKRMKSPEMEPTFSGKGETLLVRKISFPSARNVFVGDVVVHKDPLYPLEERVRRIAAMQGEEMVSSDDNDKPFVLERGTCWVLCDNESASLKDFPDSRTFGPLPLMNILGRAIYTCGSRNDHGYVRNSLEAMQEDSPVLAVELDIDELSQNENT